jgi:hypothetical protein
MSVHDQGNFIAPREFEGAKDKVGRTARARLAWALQFAQQDPEELTAGELLDARIMLHAFSHPSDTWDSPVQLVYLPDAASVAEARREIASLLLPLKPNQIRTGKIELTYEVSCTKADGPPVVGFMSRTGGAVMGFIHLLNEYRTELRRCRDPKCRHWLTGRPNKHFCSITCLSRTTTERLRKGAK